MQKNFTHNWKNNKSMEMYWEMTEMMELVFKDTKIMQTYLLCLNDLEENMNIRIKDIGK